jgi:hypothetical protein
MMRNNPNDFIDDEKNYEKQLEKLYQRLAHLGNLIQIINGSFLTVFLAFFTIALNSQSDVCNPNACVSIYIPLVCISILFIWRYYIHFIDTEIIDVYRRIIYCETILNFTDKVLSLRGILKRQTKRIIFFNRGQFFFDIIALVIMIALDYDYLHKLGREAPLFIISTAEIVIFAIFIIIQNIKDIETIEEITR